MSASQPTIADEIERYLRTGDADFMERGRRQHADLRGALVDEVRRFAKGRTHKPVPEDVGVAFTRAKVEPMVRGLFSKIGVEPQSTKYANGLPDGLNPPITPLPFLHVSTGAVTKFTNLLDPEPRSWFVFHVHRPETPAEWLSAPTLDAWVRDNGAYSAADDTKPSSLRARLRAMPELDPGGLYPNQIQAITNLEASMRQDKPGNAT